MAWKLFGGRAKRQRPIQQADPAVKLAHLKSQVQSIQTQLTSLEKGCQRADIIYSEFTGNGHGKGKKAEAEEWKQEQPTNKNKWFAHGQALEQQIRGIQHTLNELAKTQKTRLELTQSRVNEFIAQAQQYGDDQIKQIAQQFADRLASLEKQVPTIRGKHNAVRAYNDPFFHDVHDTAAFVAGKKAM